MKNYITGTVGFFVGIALASIYFSVQIQKLENSKVPPIKTVEANIDNKDKITDPNNPCYGFSYDKLSAPKFAASLPEKLMTNRYMEVKVAWEGVPGAKSYNVYVERMDGSLVRKYETRRTFLFLSEIPLPPEARQVDYVVRLASVNGADKVGDKGESRSLKVNRQGSVVAPTLKKIEVED